MSPPMTRVGGHEPMRAECCLLLARPLGGPSWTLAIPQSGCGETSSSSPIGLGAWGYRRQRDKKWAG